MASKKIAHVNVHVHQVYRVAVEVPEDAAVEEALVEAWRLQITEVAERGTVEGAAVTAVYFDHWGEAVE